MSGSYFGAARVAPAMGSRRRAARLRADATDVAVGAGSFLLVGPLAFAVVFLAVEAALRAAPVAPATASRAAVLSGLAGGLYVATEAAVLRQRGTGALHRGTRHEVVFRHAVLSAVAVTGLLEAGWFAVWSLAWSLGTADGEVVGALSVLLVVAVWGALLLFGLGLREGHRA